MKQKTNLAPQRVMAMAALAIVIAAVGLSGEQQPGLQPQPSETQCASTAADHQERPGPNANVPMTAAQGAAILRELHAIRLLLQNGAAPGIRARQPAAPRNVKMRVDSGWYELGSADAPVVMVEFADLQCPFCRRFQTATFAELEKDYIDTGKLRFVARDLPLPMHPYALGAAEAARCAGEQGKFWQFRDAVLDDQAPPAPDLMVKHARELGVNMKEFQACLNDGKYARAIEADRNDAAAIGIRGTPSFVIGRVDGGWLQGLALTGARPLPFFQQEIEKMLKGSPSGSAQIQPAGRAPSIRGPDLGRVQ